jgi:hypothetical protein
MNKYHIADFQLNLSYESWGMVFDENYVNEAFKIFLNIFLRIHYHSFPLMQTNKQSNRNSWISPGILFSCKHKRDLYTQLRNDNNPITISHYKKYSKILMAFIEKANTWNMIN